MDDDFGAFAARKSGVAGFKSDAHFGQADPSIAREATPFPKNSKSQLWTDNVEAFNPPMVLGTHAAAGRELAVVVLAEKLPFQNSGALLTDYGLNVCRTRRK